MYFGRRLSNDSDFDHDYDHDHADVGKTNQFSNYVGKLFGGESLAWLRAFDTTGKYDINLNALDFKFHGKVTNVYHPQRYESCT